MTTDFGIFRERLVEACAARNVTEHELRSSLGPGAWRAVELYLSGIQTLDVEHLDQIADKLQVSADWLLGRSSIMDLPKQKVEI